jgi:6-phosphogluconolactonase
MNDVVVCRSPQALAGTAAEIFRAAAARAVSDHGRFTVALAGGRTPVLLYRTLAQSAAPSGCAAIPWDRIHVFWSDERHVPPSHPDSNFRMATDALLDHVPIPATQITRIHGETPSAATAAEAYAEALREAFELQDGEFPVFDLMLLGMGADGHTASLFPGDPALSDTRRIVEAPWVVQVRAHRITLTPPVLTRAARTVVLVTGADKAATVQAVLDGPSDVDRYPVQCLLAAQHGVTWLIDRDAAAGLSAATGPSA